MYPKISDFINDIFGTNINLPIQSYGFFVALAFFVATLILYYELKRKEKEGVIPVQFKKVLKGKPAGFIELSISFILGFIIGYKIIGAILIYSSFAEQPSDYIFSLKGNIWGGIAFGAYSLYTSYRNKKKDLLENPVWEDIKIHPYELTANLIFIAAVSGIIGAKIFHQLENIDEFLADPVGSLLSFSGLTFYGGLIVAGLTLLFYAKKKNIPKAHLADAIAPVLMIGYAIGRIGCQVAGDGDWGIVNLEPKPAWLSFLPEWLWAYDYPHNVLNMGVFIDGCVGTNCFHLADPVFPTPVYETITCFLMFLGLWLSRKKIKIPGILFSVYLILNGIERFFIEKIRINETYTIFNLQITQAEIISVLLIIAGIISIFLFIKYHNKNKIIS